MKKKLSKEEKQARFKEMWQQINMVKDKIANKNKKVKVRNPKPGGYTARRIGAVVGWAVVLSSGAYAISGKHDTEAKSIKPHVIQIQQNQATSQAAVQFAKDFASIYFSWNVGDDAKKYRESEMSKYLASGLDVDAGLNQDEIKTASVFKDSKIKNVEDIGKNKAKITLTVIYEVTPQQQGANNAPPAPKLITKSIIIPVEFDGKSYGVYDLPTFTTTQAQTTIKVNDKNNLTKVPTVIDVQNINNFLNTFFESYSQDSKDKLSYILEDSKYQNGLQKTMNFVKVQESEVYEGKNKNQYIVDCKVEFADPDSGSQFLTDYRLTVEKQDDHYVVTKIN